MFLLAADSAPANSFAIPALVTGVAALISPTLALARWVQEKSIKHQYREEMRRCGELLDFVQRCPEVMSAIGASESAVLEKARVELGHCANNVERLLDAKLVKASPPLEMAWPRRWLLLYAPRSWGAALLHAVYNLVIVFCLLALFGLGFNDETDAFQWSEYARVFRNPVFLVGVCVCLFQFWLLWYIATTKDTWDNTLPVRREQLPTHFLRVAPTTVRSLFARVMLAYSTFELIVPLGVRGPVRRELMTNPSVAAILSAIPEAGPWGRVLTWTAAIMCPLLAYLWAQAEYGWQEKRFSLAFPHNFRFLYPSSGWKEVFAQVSVLLFFTQVVALVIGTREGLRIASRFTPKDDVGFFLTGFLLGPAVDLVLGGLLPIYAAYRLGFISYLLRMPHTSRQFSE